MKNRIKRLIAYILTIFIALDSISCYQPAFADELEIVEDLPDTEAVGEIEEIDETGIEEIFDEKVEEIEEVKAAAPAVPVSFNAGPGNSDSVKATIDESYKLTISGDDYMEEWVRKADVPWKNYIDYIKEVEVVDGVKSIAPHAFQEFYWVKSIELPDSIEKIGNQAFADVTLSQISMPITARVERSAFDIDNDIETVNLTKGISENVVSYNSITYQYTPWARSKVSNLTIEFDKEITKIGAYAFYGSNDITSLEFDKIESIGEKAFANCTELSSVLIDNPEKVIDIQKQAFENCRKLTDIELPVSSTFESGAFNNCNNISDISFLSGNGIWTDYSGDSGNEKKYYRNTPWHNCGARNDISLSFANGIENVGTYAFAGCKAITDFSGIPISSIKSIGAHAFMDCESMVSFDVPLSVNRIETNTFKGCIALNSITFPDEVTYFGRHAFEGCIALDSIMFPRDFEKMHANTFKGCTSLEYDKLTYNSGAVYCEWYTTSTFEESSLYDLEENLITSDYEYYIFLKNLSVPPPIETKDYKIYMKISENYVSVNTITVSKNEAAVVDSLPTPSRQYMTFLGWYTDSACSDGNECSFPVTLVEDSTYFYAKWDCSHPLGFRSIPGPGDYVPGKEPSCFKDGQGYPSCLLCHKKLPDPVIVMQDGHHWYETEAPYRYYRLLDAATGKAQLYCPKCNDPDGPIVFVPIEKEEEPLELVSENRYKINLVRGTKVLVEAIEKPKGAKKWVLEVPKDKRGIVAISKKGVVKGIKAGSTEIKVNIVDADSKITNITLDVNVTTPGFSSTKYYINVGDKLFFDNIFGEQNGNGNTRLKKEMKVSIPEIIEYDAGTKTITGLKPGTSNFSVLIMGTTYKTCKIIVENPELAETSIVIDDGKYYKMKIKGATQKAEWRSEDESIARVDTAGKITPISTGVTFIHAVVNGKDMSCRVEVDYPKINFSKYQLTVNSPTNSEFDVKLIDEHDHEVEWKSSREAVASVVGGKVVAKSCGTTSITCNLNGIKFICVVDVYDPYIQGNSVVKAGKKTTYKLKNGPDDVKWEVSDESIASISKKGIFLAKKSGTSVEIRAITKDITVTRTITVK